MKKFLILILLFLPAIAFSQVYVDENFDAIESGCIDNENPWLCCEGPGVGDCWRGQTPGDYYATNSCWDPYPRLPRPFQGPPDGAVFGCGLGPIPPSNGDCANPPNPQNSGWFINSPGWGGTGGYFSSSRCGGGMNGYQGTVDYWFAVDIDEVYIRFSWLVDAALDKSTCVTGFKVPIDRVGTKDGGGGPGNAIFLSIQEGSTSCLSSDAYLKVQYGDGLVNTDDLGVTAAEFKGTGWNTLEYRLKLGQGNGVIQFWFNGVLRHSNTSADFGTATVYFSDVRFGPGNTSDFDWQGSWAEMGYDNLVIAGSYVGPPDNGDPPVTTPMIEGVILRNAD